MNKITIMLSLLFVLNSCSWYREKKAGNNQPYKPHKAKKSKHKHLAF